MFPSALKSTGSLCGTLWRVCLTSSQRNIHLGGIYPPLTTPFNDNESIAFDKLAANLEKYAKIPFAGYVVQGSNGEYPYLDTEEKLEIVRFVKEFTKDSKKPLIAGSGCECKNLCCSENSVCYSID